MRPPRFVFAIASLVSWNLAFVCLLYATVSLQAPSSFYDAGVWAWSFLLFGGLSAAYAAVFFLGVWEIVKPGSVPIGAAKAQGIATTLGFLSVIPLATAGGFTDNIPVIVLVSVFAGSLCYLVAMLCSRPDVLLRFQKAEAGEQDPATDAAQ